MDDLTETLAAEAKKVSGDLLTKLDGLDPLFVERRNEGLRKIVVDEILEVKKHIQESWAEDVRRSSRMGTHGSRKDFVWGRVDPFGIVLTFENTPSPDSHRVWPGFRYLSAEVFLTDVDALVASVLKGERDGDLSKGGRSLAYELLLPYKS